MGKKRFNTVKGNKEKWAESQKISDNLVELDKKNGHYFDVQKIYEEGDFDPDAGYKGLEEHYKPLPGNYFDPYEEYIPESILKGRQYSKDEIDLMRAQNQSHWDQFGNFFGRIASNIIPQVMGGFASMADVKGWFDAEHAAQNDIVNWADDWKRRTDEDWFPIYEEEPGEFMQMGDPAWWYSRGSGLVESIGSFLVQGWGIGKLIPLVTKSLAGATGASKLTRAILDSKAIPKVPFIKNPQAFRGAEGSKRVLDTVNTVATAALLNQSEAVLEATQVYNDIYQESLDKGFGIKRAKEDAANAAALTMKINKLNILLNLSSAKLFLSPSKFRRQLIKHPTKLRTLGRLAFEGVQEGTEELVNLVAEKAGRAKGRKEKYTFQNALQDIGTMEGFEAAFLGAIGGIGQTGLTTAARHSKYGPGSTKDEEGNKISYITDLSNKYAKQQESIEKLIKQGVKVNEGLKNTKEFLLQQERMKVALENGDIEELGDILNNMFESQVLGALQAGTIEVLESLYEVEKNKDPDEVGEEYIQNAENAIKNIRELEKIYNNFEEYANVNEIWKNRANKIRYEKNQKIAEENKTKNDLELADQVRTIASKYTLTEREILIKKDGEETTEIHPDKKPLTYNLSDLENNPENTKKNKATYNKFLNEVKKLPAYSNNIIVTDNVNTAKEIIIGLEKEFKNITSKKYQRELQLQAERKALAEKNIEKLKATSSISEIEKLKKEVNNEEFTKAADERIKEINKAAKAEKANIILKKRTKGVRDKIANLTEENISDKEIKALKKEISDLKEVSTKVKKDLKLKVDEKVDRIKNGEEQEAPIEEVPVDAEKEVGDDVDIDNADLKEIPDLQEIPNPLTDEESSEKDVKKAINTVVDSERPTEGNNRFAYLSRDYIQKAEEGDGTIVITKEDITDQLNQKFFHLLNPDTFLPGTEILLQIDTDYTGDQYKEGSLTKELEEWIKIEADLRELYGEDYKLSDEYIEKVPIKITTKDGTYLAHVHDVSWIKLENVAASESELENDKNKLRAIRKAIIDSEGGIHTKINYKGFGRIIRTADGKAVPVTEAMPDQNLILAVGKNEKYSGIKISPNDIINNEKPKDGRLYSIVPVGSGKYLAIALQRETLSQKVQSSILKAIEIYIKGKGNKDNLNEQDRAIVEQVAEKFNQSRNIKIDITTTKGIRAYLEQFVYLVRTQKNEGLEPILSVSTADTENSWQSSMSLITVTGNSIEFGRPGVNSPIGKKDKNGNTVTQRITVISENFAIGTNNAALEILASKNFLPKMLSNAHIKSLGTSAVFIEDSTTETEEGAISETIVTTESYNEYLKSAYKTNILSVNIGTEEKPKWVYTLQPTYTFDTSFAADIPTSSNASSKTKTREEIKNITDPVKPKPKKEQPLEQEIEEELIEDYKKLTKNDLKALLKERNIPFKSKDNKATLIEKLKQDDKTKEEAPTVEEEVEEELTSDAIIESYAHQDIDTIDKVIDIYKKRLSNEDISDEERNKIEKDLGYYEEAKKRQEEAEDDIFILPDGTEIRVNKFTNDDTDPSEEGEAKEEVEKTEEEKDTIIPEDEYQAFIDRGEVSNARINSIANKIKNDKELSPKEQAIFNDKTSEINEKLQEFAELDEKLTKLNEELEKLDEQIKETEIAEEEETAEEVEKALLDIETKKQKALTTIRETTQEEKNDLERKDQVLWEFVGVADGKNFYGSEQSVKKEIIEYYNEIIFEQSRSSEETQRLLEIKKVVNKLGKNAISTVSITYDSLVGSKKSSEISGNFIEQQIQKEIDRLSSSDVRKNIQKFGNAGEISQLRKVYESILSKVKEINAKKEVIVDLKEVSENWDTTNTPTNADILKRQSKSIEEIEEDTDTKTWNYTIVYTSDSGVAIETIKKSTSEFTKEQIEELIKEEYKKDLEDVKRDRDRDSDIEAKKADIEKRRQEELDKNEKSGLKLQDMKTKVSETFGTLEESKNFLLEKYKGNEVIEFMINNLYDVNPGSNAYVDLEEWPPSDIKNLGLKNNKLEEAILYNFPKKSKKEVTKILSPVSEEIFLEHKGALLATVEGKSGLPNNLYELNKDNINAKYDAELAALEKEPTKISPIISENQKKLEDLKKRREETQNKIIKLQESFTKDEMLPVWGEGEGEVSESEQLESTKDYFIKGLNDARLQSSIINYFSSLIIDRAIAAKGKKKSQKKVDSIVLEEQKEVFKNLSKFFKKNGLKNKAKKIDLFLNDWAKVIKLTGEQLSLIRSGRVTETELSDTQLEEGMVRTQFSDDWQYMLDSKKTTSKEIREFFSSIELHFWDGKKTVKETNSLMLPEILPFDVVYDTLHMILANNPSNFEELVRLLHVHEKKFPWIASVISKIENAPEALQNAFTSNMTQHHRRMQFILWRKDKDGNYFLENYSANSAAAEYRIRTFWHSNLKSLYSQTNLTTINDNDEYIINPTVAKELLNTATKWSNNPENVTFEDLSIWLGNFGIVLNDSTYEDLKKGKLRKTSWKGIFKNKNGLVQILASYIEPLTKENAKELLVDNMAIFNDSIIKELSKLEAFNTTSMFSNSFNAGTKTVYSYGNNNFLINRARDLVRDLKEETVLINGKKEKIYTNELLDNLRKVSFAKDSLILKDLSDVSEVGELAREHFKIDYLSLEAFKKKHTKSKDNAKLNNLTALEHEIDKINLFFNNGVQGVNNRRNVVFFYPTISDKTNIMLVNTLSHEIKFVDLGKSRKLTNSSKDLLFDALVLPEINRIINNNKKNQKDNLENYEPNYFYFLPVLNTLEVSTKKGKLVEEGTGDKQLLIDAIRDNAEIVNEEEIRNKIKEEISIIFQRLLKKKLEVWDKLGIGKTIKDDNGKITDQFSFLDARFRNIPAISHLPMNKKVEYAAADFVFNSLINNAEMFKLIVGDPALFAKFESTKDLETNLANTFTNIGHRLAKDIAPGLELANSHKNKYYQVFLKDKKFPSKNLSNPKIKEYFEKIAPLYSEEYGKIQVSDAQEYTTWKEHLYVLKQLGRLDTYDYDRITNILEKGNELKNEDLGLVFQPMKPVYSGTKVINDIESRIYIKSSSFPLLPQLTKGFEIDKLRKALEAFEEEGKEERRTVRASFGTANKVGAITEKSSLEVFDDNGNVLDDIKITENNALELSRENFRIQQDVPYNVEKRNSSIGTQERKLLFVDLLDVEIEDGVTGEDLYREYTETYKELFKDAQENLARELGIDPESKNPRIPIKSLQNILIKEVKSREGYPLSILEALELNEEGTDFEIPLWASPYASKFENILTSIVGKKVIRQEFPGHSYILGSSKGFTINIKEGEEALKEYNKIKKEIIVSSAFDPKEGLLPMRPEFDKKTGKVIRMLPAQIMIPFKFRDNKGNLLYAKDFVGKDGKLDFDKIPQEILQLFSFRIPTQHRNSMAAVEIVGFLPETSGDLILTPDDFVNQMGSDFDLDKLYTYMYNTYYKDGKLRKDFLSDKKKIEKKTEEINKEIKELEETLKLSKEERQAIRVWERKNDIEETSDNKKGLIAIINKLGNEALVDLYLERRILKRSYKASLQNKILDIHRKIMLSTNAEVIRSIITVDSFGEFKKLADEVYENRKTKLLIEKHDTILSDEYQKEKYINATAGKNGTANFALDSGLNALMQGHELVYKNLEHLNKSERIELFKQLTASKILEANAVVAQFGEIVSKGELSNKYTLRSQNIIEAAKRNGIPLTEEEILNLKTKSSIIRALQSTSVDNEKAQILHKININDETFNAIRGMIQLGFEENDIVGLLSQDIIWEYIDKIKLNRSSLVEYKEDLENIIREELAEKYDPEKKLETLNPDSKQFSDLANPSGEILLSNIKNENLKLARPEKGSPVSDYNLQQILLVDKFIKLSEIGRDLKKLQSGIKSERKGVPKTLIETKLQVDQIEQTAQSVVFNSDKLLGKFDKATQELITPTTIAGFAAYYGTMFANNIYSSYFPYKSEGVVTIIEEIKEHILKGHDLSNVKEVEFRNLLFKNIKSYVFSTTKTGLFTDDTDATRKTIFIDSFEKGKVVNQSTASILQTLSKERWFKENNFLNKLTWDINIDGTISRINYESSTGENFDERNIYLAFADLLNQSTPIGTFKRNNKNIEYTKRMLAQELIIASYLEGGIQGAKQHLRYIPINYLKNIGFGKYLSNILFSPEIFGIPESQGAVHNMPSFFAKQFIQNNPGLVKPITVDKITDTTVPENWFRIKDVNYAEFQKEVIDEEGQTKKVMTQFLTIYDPTAAENYALYEFTNDDELGQIYRRIPVLKSKYGFVQYNYNKPNVSPIFIEKVPAKKPAASTTSNNSNPVAPKKTPEGEFNPNVVDSTPTLELSDLTVNRKKNDPSIEARKELLNALELRDGITNYNRDLISALRKMPGQILDNIKLQYINDLKESKASFDVDANVVTLNLAFFKGVPIDLVATAVAHEIIHGFTSHSINLFESDQQNKLTKEQINIIKRIESLRKKYIKNLKENEGEEGLRNFAIAYWSGKYKQQSKKFRFTYTLEQYLKSKNLDKPLEIPNIENISDEELSKYYGAINTKEFVTMALTDLGFQQELNSIIDEDAELPFWGQLKKLIIELLESLGLDIKEGSLLRPAIEEALELIKLNAKIDKINNPIVSESVEKKSKASTTSSVTNEVISISPDYGVTQVETNPTEQTTEQFVGLIRPQVENQTFKENKGRNANMMFHYGLRWGRRNGNPAMGIPAMKSPIDNNPSDGGTYYGYDQFDQNGNPLPSLSDLQPIIEQIQNSLGIDMSNYDSVIGNIYLPGEYVYPHRDTTESKSARKYPVVVYTIGNDAGLGIWDGNKGKTTFANTYDTAYAPGTLKNNNPTNELLTKNGSIYTFGMEGKGRFELVHTTPSMTEKPNAYPPLKLPNGRVVTNYTITLTFRRAQNLESGMPLAPVKLKPSTVVPPTTQSQTGVDLSSLKSPDISGLVKPTLFNRDAIVELLQTQGLNKADSELVYDSLNEKELRLIGQGKNLNWAVIQDRINNSTQPTGEVSINTKKWTKDSPKENPNTAYVFTENINSIGDTRVGKGSAVIRNNPNAIGIVTKKYYFYSENRNTPEALKIKEEYIDWQGKGGWYNQNFQDTDADFELFKKVNLEQFDKLDQFDSKIFPDSFANSLASIPNRFALWLQNQLQTRYGLITEVNSKGTGLISKSVHIVPPITQPQTETVITSMSDITNHSGGALGADSVWDNIGKEFGQTTHNHYYYGNKTPKGNVLLTEDQVKEGIVEMNKAAKILDKNPQKQSTINLLARNWFQVKNADAVFAIAKLTHEKSTIVEGGTGWAVAMAWENNKPVFVFDLKTNKWFLLDKEASARPIELEEAPVLTKNFAGIGSREITTAGEQAIRDVYEKTQASLKITQPQAKVINIYAGTNENAHLSNFAERPFVPSYHQVPISLGIITNFRTVEGAFQAAKLLFTDYFSSVQSPPKGKTRGDIINERNEFLRKLSNATGKEAKKLGRTIPDLDTTKWELDSSDIMKTLIKESFQQNPEALQTLLATEDAILTHTQADVEGKGPNWGKEFPKILMEVRKELKELQLTTQPQAETKEKVNFSINDIVEYKGKKGTIEGFKEGQVNNIRVRFDDNTLLQIKPENLKLIKKIEKEPIEKISNKIDINGTSINTGDIILNSQQFDALQNVANFIDSKIKMEDASASTISYTLAGYAGTGKTTLTKFIVQYLEKKYTNYILASPTHKAKEVLKKITDKPAKTLAAALGLQPGVELKDYNLQDKIFIAKNEDKLPSNGIFVIDESSMIKDALFKTIIDTAKRKGTKVLFIGDDGQLKPVGQRTKSKAFLRKNNISLLTKVMRTADGNPMPIEVLQPIRDNPTSKTDVFEHITKVSNENEGIKFTNSNEVWTKAMLEEFTLENFGKNSDHVRALAYTNKRVESLNSIIRTNMFGFGAETFYPGEVLMLYQNLYYDFATQEYMYPNGSDIIIKSVTFREDKIIRSPLGNTFTVAGYELSLQDTETGELKKDNLFVADMNVVSKEYLKELEILKTRAINAPRNLKGKSWSEYYTFSSQYNLTRNIYEVNGNLFISETEALKVLKTINPNATKKTLGKYKVKDKSIDYAYSHTIHKSQASTYDYIFIDENNIDIGRQFTNPDFESINQLKYVGFSRSSKLTYSLSSKTDTEVEQSTVAEEETPGIEKYPAPKDTGDRADINDFLKDELLASFDTSDESALNAAEYKKFLLFCK